MNPDILVSVINTKLRNNYQSLAELCDDLEINKVELEKILKKHDYFYLENINQIK